MHNIKGAFRLVKSKGPEKRGHIVADTLLPKQMFPRLPTRVTFVADTNFVSGTQKMFLILFRNILCLQQLFPSLRSPRNIMGNNVSATMCPRLPGPQAIAKCAQVNDATFSTFISERNMRLIEMFDRTFSRGSV